VDGGGNAYITGETAAGFVTSGNVTSNGGDALVAKFDPTGALVYSTFLGGTGRDLGNAIAVDATGNTVITGETASTDFPTTAGVVQPAFGTDTAHCVSGTTDPCPDAFVAKFDPTGKLVYSTYLGAAQSDSGTAIDIDAQGNAYVAGQT